MSGRRFPLLILVLLLLLAVTIPAGVSDIGSSAPPFLVRAQQRELLGYARALFLSRLGYGAPPSAPTGVPAVQRACAAFIYVHLWLHVFFCRNDSEETA